MAILASPDHFEQDREGEIEQTLVAVRYVGNRRRYTNRSVASQGLWPEYTSFRKGSWYVAFVPESVPDGVSAAGVAWFERNDNFEVAYDPERIAEILLDQNYVDLQPGGPIGERDALPNFQEKVHDALNLQPQHVGGTYEEQLRELADVDEDVGPDDPDPVDELVNAFTRGELSDSVKAVREDSDEFSLRGVTMEEMAEYLVDQTDDPEATVLEAN